MTETSTKPATSKPICRFAPSPTGYLHIGGARTARFNWLFARHHGGTMRLRIEDTDRERSIPAAIDAILDGIRWLGLDWDGVVVFQFARMKRHAEVVDGLLAKGRAYRCWATPAELEEMRAAARAKGLPPRYDGRWRDRDPKEAPQGVRPAIRLRAPQLGETVIRDLVQGDVVIRNDQLDDMILLRGDGTPTYMLSVVVDDQDMDVTHVIRGDDHLNNAARQMQLIQALDWPVPAYAHIPLIHGPDGAKLSKRHGAMAVHDYRDMGYLPEAMRNYLLRLGWAHGDSEIVSTDEAIRLFDLDGIGRAPARLDFKKLDHVNGHYIRAADDPRLVELTVAQLAREPGITVDAAGRARLLAGMPGLKARARTIVELAESSVFYLHARPIPIGEPARKLLTPEARARLAALRPALESAAEWTAPALEALVRASAAAAGVKLGELAQPLRAGLTGDVSSPPIFEVMAVLGRDETLGRLADALGG